MTLQENLKEFSPYNIDFKIQNEWFVIGVEYNDKWQIIKPSNNKIEYVKEGNKHYYGASMNEIDINDIFQCIRETIKYNQDLEKKLDLFQKKMEELQDIFANEEYENLINLEFKIEKNKKKPKKKTNKNKVKKADNLLKEIVDNTITDNNKNVEQQSISSDEYDGVINY